MKGHTEKWVERLCELAGTPISAVKPAETPCMGGHQSPPEDVNGGGELASTLAQNVLKCLFLVRIGRPGLPWTVNILARSVTKWNKDCANKLSRLVSYISHSKHHRQLCFD